MNGSVTLIWRSILQSVLEYRWENILIPQTMMVGNKLVGEVGLTAVLEPLVGDDIDDNYFKTRMEVGLRYTDNNGDEKSLLGPMSRGQNGVEATTGNVKWNPVRHYFKSFTRKTVSGGSLSLRTRIYSRNKFRDNLFSSSENSQYQVSYVLTFKDINQDPTTYDHFVQRMSSMVESAVIEQEIEIEN